MLFLYYRDCWHRIAQSFHRNIILLISTIMFYSLHAVVAHSVSPDQTLYPLSSILQFSPHNYCRSDLVSVQTWLVVSHLPAKDHRLITIKINSLVSNYRHQQPLFNLQSFRPPANKNSLCIILNYQQTLIQN